MTHPLSIFDLAFFVLESAERPMNVGPLMVLVPPPQRGRRSFADLLHERMMKRPAGPPFNLRFAKPSLTSLPALVDDEDFDLASHVHRIKLRKPGTTAALLAKVGELHAQRLDRSRPLWEFYLIEGLENGRIALYAKMHHGTVDGVGFLKILSQWLSPSPDSRRVRAMWEGIDGATDARRGQDSLARSAGKLLRSGVGAARTAWSLSALLWHQGLDTLEGDAGSPLPFVTTPAVLKVAPSARRSLAFCTLPLERMKALGKLRGATVNDMLLAVLDMAMRDYLDRTGASPTAPLVADMPLALGGGSGANRIAIMQVPLGATGLDPVARLDAIKRNTSTVKGLVQEGTGDAAMLHSVLSHVLPGMWEGLGWQGAPLLANMVVSNPFGFTEKRYLMGAEVELAVPVSVVAPGQVLNITGVNYADKYLVAFIAMADGVPGIDKLASATLEAFETLAASLERAGSRPRSRSRPSPRTR